MSRHQTSWNPPPLIEHTFYSVDGNFPRASLVAQSVNNLPAMQETWVWSLGWEDPLEEGIATHSSILAWRIPMDRGTQQAAVHGVTKELNTTSDKQQHSKELGLSSCCVSICAAKMQYSSLFSALSGPVNLVYFMTCISTSEGRLDFLFIPQRFIWASHVPCLGNAKMNRWPYLLATQGPGRETGRYRWVIAV